MNIKISELENLIYEELENVILESFVGTAKVIAPLGVEEYQKLPANKQRQLSIQFKAFLDSGRGGLSDTEKSVLEKYFPSKTLGDTDWRGKHVLSGEAWQNFIGVQGRWAPNAWSQEYVNSRWGIDFYSKVVDAFDKWLKDNKVFNIGIWKAIQGPVLASKDIFEAIKQYNSSKIQLIRLTARVLPQIKGILTKKGKSQTEINKALDAVRDQADKMKKTINELIEDHFFLNKTIRTPYTHGSKEEKLSDYAQSRKRKIEAIGKNIIRLGTKLLEHKKKIDQSLGVMKKDVPKLIEKEYTPEEQETFIDEVSRLVMFYGSGKAIYADPSDPVPIIILAVEIIAFLALLPALTAAGGVILAIKLLLGEAALITLIMKWDEIMNSLWFADTLKQAERATKLGISSGFTPDWIIDQRLPTSRDLGF